MRGGGWSCDLLLADREDVENLSTTQVHVEGFKHKEDSQEEPLSLPCADGTFKHLDLRHPCRGERSASGRGNRRRNSLRRRWNFFWSMSGDFIYYLYEVHGKKRYIPTEETVHTPMESVDVMGQTRATRDTGSEHTFNDCCYD